MHQSSFTCSLFEFVSSSVPLLCRLVLFHFIYCDYLFVAYDKVNNIYDQHQGIIEPHSGSEFKNKNKTIMFERKKVQIVKKIRLDTNWNPMRPPKCVADCKWMQVRSVCS